MSRKPVDAFMTVYRKPIPATHTQSFALALRILIELERPPEQRNFSNIYTGAEAKAAPGRD
jgi:hypothetical protein